MSDEPKPPVRRRRKAKRDPVIGDLDTIEQLEKRGFDADGIVGGLLAVAVEVAAALADGRVDAAEALRIGRKVLGVVHVHRKKTTIPPG